MRRSPLLLLASLAIALSACERPFVYDWDDPEAAQVTITSPSEEVFTQDSVSFQVVVDREVDRVELLVDGVLHATLSPPYTYQWNTTNTPDAKYTVSARAYRYDLVSGSNAVSVNVDHVPPTVDVQRPASGDDNVYVGDALRVIFSEELLETSVTDDSVVIRRGDTVEIPRSVSVAGQEIVVYLQGSPPVPNTMSVELKQTITDRAGNQITPTTWSFTVPEWVSLEAGLDASGGASAPALTRQDDTLLAAWNRGGQVAVQRWTGSQWLTLGSAQGVQATGTPAIAVDMNGGPLLSWTDNGALYSVAFDGSDWSTMSGLGAPVGAAPAMRVGVDGVPTIGYENAAGDIEMLRFENTQWAAMSTPPVSGCVNPSLAVEERVLVGCPFGGGGGADVAIWNGAWTSLGNLAGGTAFQVALDLADMPYAAWIETDSVIVMVHQSGTDWAPLPALGVPGITDLAFTTRQGLVAVTAAAGAVQAYRFDKSTQQWSPIGASLTFAGGVTPQVVLDDNEQPLVIWEEGGNVLVKRYNSL